MEGVFHADIGILDSEFVSHFVKFVVMVSDFIIRYHITVHNSKPL